MSNAAPKLTYAQEQAALMRKHEGKDQIRIEPPREPEVNPEVYRDVMPMLFRGFLTVSAKIGGATFVFKSLNHHEFGMLQLMGVMDKDAGYRQWDMLLAYNVLMIDGQNVLIERERWVPKIIETFGQMDHKPKQHIIRHMSEINRRANNAVHMSECYSLEVYSRYRWAQLQGIDLCSTTTTGFPGTERLGLNWAQLTWRAINYYEDMRESHEREWDNAKFVASSMAGKGIQKIYQQDNDRRQKDREERVARKDRILREVLLGEKTPDKAKQLAGAVLTGASTVEELAKQLESDLRGEKDWHDQVIEAHEQSIKRNVQGRQEQVRQLNQKHEEEFGGKKLLGGTTDFSGLSIAEVQERITRRKQIEAQQASKRIIRPERPEIAEVLQDPKSRGFMDKWGLTASAPQEGVNFSIEQTDRDASSAVPIAPPRQGGTPFRRR